MDDERVHRPLYISVLLFLYLERLGEIVIVLLLILLALLWGSLLPILQENLWPLFGVVVFSMAALTVLYHMDWCRRSPGFLVFKLHYMVFLTAVFLFLDIHVPHLLPIFSSYFALVAAGTIAVIYVFLALIVVIHEHFYNIPIRGYRFWLIMLTIPFCMLAIYQPIYFTNGIWRSHDYWQFMLNICIGIVVSLPFFFEATWIFKRFVTSKNVTEFFKTKALLPGFVTAAYAKEQENDEHTANMAHMLG